MKAATFGILVLFCLALSTALLAQAPERHDPPPSHDTLEKTMALYPAIDDPRARAFLWRTLDYASQLLEPPAVPVRQVTLRRSRPLISDISIAAGFNCTHLHDYRTQTDGVFTIFLSDSPTESDFYGILAHETAHLLNAKLLDAYVEGLNNVFAEKVLQREGLDWTRWINYYRSNSNFEPLYAQSYFMMRDIWATVGDEGMKNFLSYAVYDGDDKINMHIDIDEWLASLPSEKRSLVTAIIGQYSLAISNALPFFPAQGNNNYMFVLPRETKTPGDELQPQVSLRSELQSDYDIMEAAYAAKDVEGYLYYHAHDFVSIAPNGRVTCSGAPQDHDQAQKALMAGPSPPAIPIQDTIQDVTRTSDGVVVSVQIAYPNHKGQTVSARDFWVRNGGVWQIKRHRLSTTADRNPSAPGL